MADKSLYVSELPEDIREEDIEELFADFAPLTRIHIERDHHFAIVDLPEDKAQQAAEALNGSEVRGHILSVNEAGPPLHEPLSGGGEAGAPEEEYPQ